MSPRRHLEVAELSRQAMLVTEQHLPRDVTKVRSRWLVLEQLHAIPPILATGIVKLAHAGKYSSARIEAFCFVHHSASKAFSATASTKRRVASPRSSCFKRLPPTSNAESFPYRWIVRGTSSSARPPAGTGSEAFKSNMGAIIVAATVRHSSTVKSSRPP